MYVERQLCAGAVQEGPLVTTSSTAAFLPVAWLTSLFHKHEQGHPPLGDNSLQDLCFLATFCLQQSS